MSFARGVWRLLVGIKDALALLFLLLFFSLLFAALAARPNPGVVRDGALLLNLQGSVVEEPAAIDPLAVLLSQTLPTREYSTRDLVRVIDEAAGDERIEALALDLTTFTGGGAVHMRDLTEALDRFRRSDKPVFTYAVAYSDDSLMLAAHADEAWVDPMGGMAIRGPGGERLYYADALARFNINARVFRVGTYKSAVEPYLGNGMSEEARENTAAIYDSLWEEWQANISSARPEADLDAAIAGYPALIEAAGGDLAQAAVNAGLVDRIGTYEDWGDRIAEEVGKDEWIERPGAFAHTEYDPYLADIADAGLRTLSGQGKIGVVTIAGEISDGDAGPGSAGAARIADLLDNALNDDLDALVVRIDSPGGTVTGSETIRRAIMRHKDQGTPIVVSMVNYAASGGYWAATPADRIFAEPETLTGSIGVFLVVPTFEDLLAEYGVTTDGVRTTPYSGQPDLLAGLTPETEALMQTEVDGIYTRFLTLVADARGIAPERADELGQGRVWAGGTARQLGLVDGFGGLDNAFDTAAELAELGEGEWSAVYLTSDAPPFGAAFAQALGAGDAPTAAGGVSAMLAQREQDLAARLMDDLERLFSATGVQARCLECAAWSAPRRAAPGGADWRALARRALGL